MGRRLVQLYAGLALYGISDAMLLLAHLGVDPWDVLHQGLARLSGMQVGTWTIFVGVAVMLAWILLVSGVLLNGIATGLYIGAGLFARKEPGATSRGPSIPRGADAQRRGSYPSRGPDRPTSRQAAR